MPDFTALIRVSTITSDGNLAELKCNEIDRSSPDAPDTFARNQVIPKFRTMISQYE